ncbi:uncharacterized protein VTP21DRAFT_301 [Calcarisporiella thermophila]|uniref:uncharacterized protein n=1 Tax=Calcarisporiella thermophila TaxID=911321 RepID=UPI003743A947
MLLPKSASTKLAAPRVSPGTVLTSVGRVNAPAVTTTTHHSGFHSQSPRSPASTPSPRILQRSLSLKQQSLSQPSWIRRRDQTLKLGGLLSKKTKLSRDGMTKVTLLENGVRIATMETDISGLMASVGVFVSAGSRFETEQSWGTSHIVDRLAFKSTKHRTTEQILDEIAALGGNFTCTSSRESIMYQSAIFKRDIRQTLALLSDVVQHPLITPEEVEEQREAIAHELSEMTMEALVPEIVHMTAFPGGALGNSMVCTGGHLSKMTPDVVRKYMQEWFRPERLVITAAGIPHEELVSLVSEYFGKESGSALQASALQAAPSPLPSPKPKASRYRGGTRLIPQPDLPHTHLCIAFEAPAASHPDAYPLAAIHLMLGGGGTFSEGGPGKGVHTRLYSLLMRHSWLESCHAFHHAYSDGGLIGVWVVCATDHNLHAVEVVARELFLLTRDPVATSPPEAERSCADEATQAPMLGGVTLEELTRAKTRLKSALLMRLESKLAQVEELARQLLLLGDVSVEEAIDRIDAVGQKDVVRVARRVFSGEKRPTVVGVGNVRGLKAVERILVRWGLLKR